MADLPLRLVSETASTVTLGWTPPASALGFLFWADSRRSSTLDGSRSTVKFAKGAAKYRVQALGLTAEGSYPPAAPTPGYPASFFTGPLGANNIVPSKPGAFLIENFGGPGNDWSKIQAKIVQRETDMGRKFDGIHVQYWGGGSYQGVFGIDSGTILERREQWIHDRGQHSIVTWSPDYTIGQVNSGQADAVYKVAAQHFKSYGFPIMLRLWWEFDNEDATSGFPWAVGKSPDIGANFVKAWRRVVGLFQAAGASNVGFWFCPLEGSPDRAGIDSSYPGDAYVDWVGSDVYMGCYVGETNCYSSYALAGWQSFEHTAIYLPEHRSHSQYALRAATKPFAIGELGVGQPFSDNTYPAHRGNWFRGIPTTLRTLMPNCVGVSFFDQDVSGLEGSRNNWLVDAGPSADSYAGFRQMAADPWFNTTPTG